jgi:hypothetical protein
MMRRAVSQSRSTAEKGAGLLRAYLVPAVLLEIDVDFVLPRGVERRYVTREDKQGDLEFAAHNGILIEAVRAVRLGAKLEHPVRPRNGDAYEVDD